jgi:hypothetical protein
MKLELSTIPEKSDKQLRTLRNNLNNRISAFESGSANELKASHPLFGLEHEECIQVRDMILAEMKNRRNS